MEQKNKLVVIEVEELEAIIERAVERKLLEILKHDNKSLGRDGRLSLKDVMIGYTTEQHSLKTIWPYYTYYPSSIYFRIFDREFFRIISIDK